MAERIRPRALPALAEAVFASEPQSQPNIDIDEAQRFLLALAPGESEFEFQTFDDNPDRSLKNKKLARHECTALAAAIKWLARANHQFAGVFVSINKTDGIGRMKKNITVVRALMLDLDGSPLDPVLQCALTP